MEGGSSDNSFEELFKMNMIRSDERTHTIHCKGLENPDTSLQTINNEITQLQMRLKFLSSQKQLLTGVISPHQAFLSPFRRLPNDILREILLACLPTEHNPTLDIRHAPLLLTRITSHTRQVALSTPRLWAAIHVPLVAQFPIADMACAASNVMSKRASAVEEWILHRSAACDVSVSMYEALTRNERPAGDSYKKVFETIASASPRLKRLSLGLSLESFRHQDVGGSIKMFNASPLVTAVNLRNLGLSTGAANYGVYNMNWANITDISLGKDRAVSTTCIDSIFTLCPQLHSCMLYIELDGTVPRASLPHLKTLSLSFCPRAWWGVSTEYATNVFAEVYAPALESLAYEDLVGPLPLLGILQRAGERIAHLSLTNLGRPIDLIRCLKLCPQLIVLELEVGKLKHQPSAGLMDEDLTKWRTRIDNSTQWPSVGGLFLGCFMIGDDPDTPVPEKLCPKLECLSYRLPCGPMSCATVEKFIRNKRGLACLNSGRYGVLRELVVHVDGGETEIVQVRESVAEQLLSGLRLSLIPPLPPNLKPPRFPTDAGLLPNPRIQANNSDGDGLF